MNKQEMVNKQAYDFDDVVEIMRFLRSDEGCPWDRKQTHQSIRSNLIEEAYETLEALDSGDPKAFLDELGDLLLQVVFHAQMAAEAGKFTIDDVLSNLGHKLVTRHTHLFGDDRADSAETALRTWDQNKYKEKGFTSETDALREVSHDLPALSRSDKVQKRAAKVGFDWPDINGPRQKIREEMDEFDEALDEYRALGEVADEPNETDMNTEREKAFLHIEEEAGDILFALGNYFRHLKIQPEIALTRTTDKFIVRFDAMEKLIREDGKTSRDLDTDELNEYYYKAKDVLGHK